MFINGCPKSRVKGLRGLRQGDSLSPFLFLLVVGVVNRIVVKGVEGGSGVDIPVSSPINK